MKKREPKEIHIPFNAWSKERLRLGVKTMTSRTKKYGLSGDWFFVNGTQYILIDVFHVALDHVRQHCWQQEGCISPAEFVKVWKSLHKRAGWTPDKYVWMHVFGRASRKEKLCLKKSNLRK